MDFLDDELDNVLNIFQQESTEIIQSIGDCLDTLSENNNDEEIFLKLFRLAHSLKGSARMMGFSNIQSLAHKMEDVIGLFKDKKLSPNSDIINLLSQITEYILFLVNKTAENKKEFYTDELNSYIEKLNGVQGNNNEPTETKIISEQEKIFVKIKAYVTELCLLYLKYKSDNDPSYVHDFRLKLIELKNTLRTNNFEDEITVLNNTLGVLCRNEDNFKNYQEFDGKLIEFLDMIKDLCSKNEISNEDYLEIAKKQYDEIKNIKDEGQENNNLEVKKIRTDINQEVLTLIKEINNDIDEIRNNPNFLGNFDSKIDRIAEETQFFEIKKLFIAVKKLIGMCVSKNTYPTNNIDILKQLITDSVDVIEDVNSKDIDFKLIEDRVSLIEESFEKELSLVQNKTEIKPQTQETKFHEFRSKDWFNNIDNSEIKTLRVDSSKLDKLANQVNELIMYRIKNTEHIGLIKKFQNDFEEWSKSWHKIGYYLKYYEKRYLTGSNINLDVQSVIMHNKQLIMLYETHSESCTKMLDFIYEITKQLQDEDSKLISLSNEFEAMSKKLRILPLATIFHLFPRMVHNIATDKGKQIDFRIEGSEVSADKKIIEEIKIPLIHIIRNSIDHGIETPEERIKKGKPPVGKIGIKAVIEGNKIVIDVKDDGRGLDVEKIKTIAYQKGLLRDGDNKSEEEIMSFIFYPGFSTEEKVTELSGRGIGLNVVKESITQLDGKIDIYSKRDEGTCFRIEIPIAMSTINVFIVKEKEDYYAIDTSYITIVTKIDPSDIYVQDGKNHFVYNKKVIPILSLSQTLGKDEEKLEVEKATVMILEYEGNSVGIIVDKLIGDQEIIQKKLSSPLINVQSVSGVTTLANGETCLILNIKNIFSYLSKNLLLNIVPSSKMLENKKRENYKVLVTDDSITIRTLQQNILKNLGYNVDTATNGLEALEKLRGEEFNLLVVDYDMPKMTGIELARELRDKDHNNIPIIVLTSYEKSALEEEFEPYNISAYIQKGHFNQDNFVKIIDGILVKND